MKSPAIPGHPHAKRLLSLALTSTLVIAAAEEDPEATPACPAPAAAQAAVGDALPPVELGKVAWGRDFEQAVAESQKTGKPLMVLFDEVPGCGGCKTYATINRGAWPALLNNLIRPLFAARCQICRS